jgi:hypothetical protein
MNKQRVTSHKSQVKKRVISYYEDAHHNWRVNSIALLLLAFSFTFLTCLPARVDGAVKPTNNLGIVGWWPLNEGTSTIAHDISGYGNNGTLINTPTWIEGKKGKGISMTGASSQYMNVANYSNISPSSSDFTISFWTKTSATTNADIIDAVNGNAGGFTLGFNVSVSTGSLCSGSIQKIYFNMANGTSRDVGLCSSTAINDGQWHHVAIVVRRSQDKTMYIDGVQNAQNSTSLTGSVTLPILRFAGTPAFWGYYTGSLDDIRIYNRSLDVADISALYRVGQITRQTVSQSGLVGWWTFDEGTSTKATDFSGQGNTGTFAGSPITWTQGKLGKALLFDGSTGVPYGGYVQVPNSSSLQQTAGGDFTVSLWLRPSRNYVTGGANNNIIEKAIDSANPGWGFYVDAGNNLKARLGYSGNSKDIVLGSYPTYFATSTWTHLTFRVDRVSDLAQWFVNGVAIGSATSISTVGSMVNTAALNIGAGNQGYGIDRFAGQIDDVRIYSRALSVGEISGIYRQNQTEIGGSKETSVSGGLVGYWSFNGKDIDWRSQTVYDRSGYGNNGTTTGMSTSTSPILGRVGQALYFDGGDSVDILLPSASIASISSQFTVSVWVNFADTGTFRNVIWQNINTDPNNAAFAIRRNNSNSVFIDSYLNGVRANGPYELVASVPGQWNNYTATYDGATQKLYKNGVLQNSSAVTGTVDAHDTRHFDWVV